MHGDYKDVRGEQVTVTLMFSRMESPVKGTAPNMTCNTEREREERAPPI